MFGASDLQRARGFYESTPGWGPRRCAGISLDDSPDPEACRWRARVLGSTAVRFAIPLLAAVALIALVACGGDDDDSAAVVRPAQRFVTEEDAPGSKPDSVEGRQIAADFDASVAAFSPGLIDPDEEEMTTVFQEAGLKSAGVDFRFFGDTHSAAATHVASSYIELGSEDGATSALDWLEADSRKPCPMSCAVQISSFDVDDVAGARGVRRLATAEDIERVGTANQVPSDSYWVGFTNGAFVYTVDLHGPPGSVSEEQALEIVSAYYDRLTGS
jgi:hypothetical protein